MQGCCWPNPSMASQRCKSSDGNVLWQSYFLLFLFHCLKATPAIGGGVQRELLGKDTSWCNC